MEITSSRLSPCYPNVIQATESSPFKIVSLSRWITVINQPELRCSIRKKLHDLTSNEQQRRWDSTSVYASRRMDNQDFEGGRLVDEDMIALRLRIKEMKMLEHGDDQERNIPSHWLEWEKKYIMHFHRDVYGAIGFLQLFLMDIRPALALGIVAFVVLSVSFSTGVLMLHTLEMVKEIAYQVSLL